jgi:hypothetical protein
MVLGVPWLVVHLPVRRENQGGQTGGGLEIEQPAISSIILSVKMRYGNVPDDSYVPIRALR